MNCRRVFEALVSDYPRVLARAHSRKRPALVTITFRSGRLRELTRALTVKLIVTVIIIVIIITTITMATRTAKG